MVSSVPFGRKSRSSEACSLMSLLRSSSMIAWRLPSSSFSLDSAWRSASRCSSYIWRRRATNRSASRLCASTFSLRFCSFISSSLSSSANFAMSCAFIWSSSSRNFLARSSFICICARYAFFISSLSSSCFRICISSRLRLSASSSSLWSSFLKYSSSSAALLLASIFSAIWAKILRFSFSRSSFSCARRSSCARLSAAYFSMRANSSRSSRSIASCLAFCSIMKLRNATFVSCCFSQRACCSCWSSRAILSTSSWTCDFSFRYSCSAS
mmetsp:Transcript_70271/g.203736  ORF Transcript_70271/g.203736 Transcript_70271/m.203736 type:complete len:269 (+) Transcript_70271:227-1033(+)